MKILLLEKNGQVGWELQRSFASLGELVALDRSSMNPGGDLTALDDISEAVRSLRPDALLADVTAHPIRHVLTVPGWQRGVFRMLSEIL